MMSESVSGVDAILAGLEERARREPHRGCVSLLDAEAAVHATAQKYEAALARQGAMLDRCRDERLSWEDVQRHSEAAVHATVREIEAWLRENIVGLGLGDDPSLTLDEGLWEDEDDVPRALALDQLNYRGGGLMGRRRSGDGPSG